MDTICRHTRHAQTHEPPVRVSPHCVTLHAALNVARSDAKLGARGQGACVRVCACVSRGGGRRGGRARGLQGSKV
jgi:hypothetical protein